MKDKSLPTLPRAQSLYKGGAGKLRTTTFYERGLLLEHGNQMPNTIRQGKTNCSQVRLATVLRELPFTISFEQRVSVFQVIQSLDISTWNLYWENFQSLIQREKQEQQGDRVNFLQGPSIDLHVRRSEDQNALQYIWT